ncbi:MAG TPA: hypothetical protein DIS86_06150, partial [Lactococcus sp.]|nr:hypothetical protein [Lactococcus sp.]
LYYSTMHSPTYLGIGVIQHDNSWEITKIQKDGAAERTGLLIEDKILSVDGTAPGENQGIRKWLLVEQAKQITVERDGKSFSYTFKKNKVNIYRFYEFLVLVVILLLFLAWYSQRQIISKRSTYFYYFLVSIIFTLLSIVPSSIGNTVGRSILIIMISLLPLLISVFSYKTYLLKEQAKHNRTALFCFVVFICNTLLLLANLMTDMPMHVINYLDKGIFYSLFLSIFVIGIGHIFNHHHNKSDANLVLLSLLSILPFFFCYFLQLGWSTPFSIVIPFLGLPLIALFHRLTLSKSFLFRYRIHQQVLYLAITVIVTIVMILLIALSHYVPFPLLCTYAFLLYYALLMIIGEMVSVIRKDRDESDNLTSFFVAEEEREKISLHIHDTIIQDIVFFTRKLKEKDNVPDIPEAVDMLEETIYLLRELCADVYPLMIQELGLKNALDNMVNQLQKKYPVLITIKIEVAMLQLSEKMSNFVLRSIKELIHNSIFHGEAKTIIVSITENDGYYLFEIKDDGKFVTKENSATDANHFGLDIIKEKLKLLNGELHIHTEKGTCIKFKIPVMKEMTT